VNAKYAVDNSIRPSSLAFMRLLVAVILCVTLGLLSNLSAVVEPTWQALPATSGDWAVFSGSFDPADESEVPDVLPIRLSRTKVFGKSAPLLKARRVRLRSAGSLPLQSQSHLASHQDLFRREAVLRI
jgi:hypothetical protein